MPDSQNCSGKSRAEKRLVAAGKDGVQPGTGTGDSSGNHCAGVVLKASVETELVKVKIGGSGGRAGLR